MRQTLLPLESVQPEVAAHSKRTEAHQAPSEASLKPISVELLTAMVHKTETLNPRISVLGLSGFRVLGGGGGRGVQGAYGSVRIMPPSSQCDIGT